MIRRPPRSTPLYSSAASDVYKRQARAPCRADASRVARGRAPATGRGCTSLAGIVLVLNRQNASMTMFDPPATSSSPPAAKLIFESFPIPRSDLWYAHLTPSLTCASRKRAAALRLTSVIEVSLAATRKQTNSANALKAAVFSEGVIPAERRSTRA